MYGCVESGAYLVDYARIVLTVPRVFEGAAWARLGGLFLGGGKAIKANKAGDNGDNIQRVTYRFLLRRLSSRVSLQSLLGDPVKVFPFAFAFCKHSSN